MKIENNINAEEMRKFTTLTWKVRKAEKRTRNTCTIMSVTVFYLIIFYVMLMMNKYDNYLYLLYLLTIPVFVILVKQVIKKRFDAKLAKNVFSRKPSKKVQKELNDNADFKVKKLKETYEFIISKNITKHKVGTAGEYGLSNLILYYKEDGKEKELTLPVTVQIGTKEEETLVFTTYGMKYYRKHITAK